MRLMTKCSIALMRKLPKMKPAWKWRWTLWIPIPSKIEEEAENIRASELVKQFKLEMGMSEPATELPDDLDLDAGTKETAS